MALIDDQHYPAVRAAIDPTLEPALLPDAVLALPIYVPAAILDVLALDPDAETRTGPALRRLQNAAVLFAAARALPRTPIIESEAFADYRYGRAKIDVRARADELADQARAEVAAALVLAGGVAPAPVADDRPITFTLARGSRGR